MVCIIVLRADLHDNNLSLGKSALPYLDVDVVSARNVAALLDRLIALDVRGPSLLAFLSCPLTLMTTRPRSVTCPDCLLSDSLCTCVSFSLCALSVRLVRESAVKHLIVFDIFYKVFRPFLRSIQMDFIPSQASMYLRKRPFSLPT